MNSFIKNEIKEVDSKPQKVSEEHGSWLVGVGKYGVHKSHFYQDFSANMNQKFQLTYFINQMRHFTPKPKKNPLSSSPSSNLLPSSFFKNTKPISTSFFFLLTSFPLNQKP